MKRPIKPTWICPNPQCTSHGLSEKLRGRPMEWRFCATCNAPRPTPEEKDKTS